MMARQRNVRQQQATGPSPEQRVASLERWIDEILLHIENLQLLIESLIKIVNQDRATRRSKPRRRS